MEEIRLNLDPDGFSRRECPRCKAHFKVPWGAREEHVVAAALAARVHHVNASDAACGEVERHCPYCGASAPAAQFLTSDALLRIDVHARNLEAELRWRSLRTPLDLLAANPHPTYVPVPPAELQLPRLRADWDDLTRMLLPCCGEEQKVSDAWVGPVRCHHCGTAHLRSGPRDIGLEMALLKRWMAE
jgi:uncharacterized protein (UPF0212 family)